VTAALSTTAAPGVRTALLELSRRLEGLWVQVRTTAEAVERDGAAPDGWRTADDRLMAALVALEGYAGRRDPQLGRRDWLSRACRDRDRAPAGVPRQGRPVQ